MRRPGPIRTRSHGISANAIDDDASKVLRRLQQYGYDAYLVGGGVRDLLLDRRPKDFDVATGARPQEVRKLFRNCRLIGRRFRLAHLLYGGGKVIEVATFRAQPVDEAEGPAGALITDDNEFGTPQSDACRRDFTVNALFYDLQSNEVIDYTGGLADLERRVLRTIGDPVVRFREDPVRMLRAVKFAARLEFQVGDAERRAIRSERTELRKAAIPRLLEEIFRMLWGGGARRSFELLEELGLLELMLPELSAWLAKAPGDPHASMRALLAAVDERTGGRQGVENGVLLGALFWPVYRDLLAQLPRRVEPRHLRPVAEALVGPAAVRLRMPRRDVATLLAVLEAQVRFEQVGRRRGPRLAMARNPNFPAAAELLALRSVAGEVDPDDFAEWEALLDEAPAGHVDVPRMRRRARHRRGGPGRHAG